MKLVCHIPPPLLKVPVMLAVNPKYPNALATPWGVFKPGREADFSKVPAAVKAKWLEDEVLVQTDKAPDLYEDMPLDGLSSMNRQELKQFAVNNNIPLKVKQSWTDEEVRQAIRDLTDPAALMEMLKPSPSPENTVPLTNPNS
jgi:antitoxin component of RelBE/YafQ-DinJ toxin-antitoxin module